MSKLVEMESRLYDRPMGLLDARIEERIHWRLIGRVQDRLSSENSEFIIETAWDLMGGPVLNGLQGALGIQND